MKKKTKTKTKVLHLIGGMGDGGAQRIVLNYLNDLHDDKDIEIRVLVYSDKSNSYCNNEIEKKKYKVDYIFKNAHNKYIKKIEKILFGKMRLKKYIKKYQPDIIHTHVSPLLVSCLSTIEKCNIPIKFHTLHSSPYRFVGKQLEALRKAFNDYNYIGICVTYEQANQAIEYYGLKRYEVVHNGINIHDIKRKIIRKKDARRLFSINNNTFVVGAVGRLNKIKRFDYLLDIFKSICNVKQDALLVIAGDGPERERLRKKVQILNIENNTLFLGNIDNVIDLYCAIDVLAITSESESSSLVLLESQICNTRSVISAGVPNESIITNKVKKMKKNASIEEWAKALSDAKFVGNASFTYKDYDVHKMSEKMKDIYLKYWRDYNDIISNTKKSL